MPENCFSAPFRWWMTVGMRNRYMFLWDLFFFYFATWVAFSLRLTFFMKNAFYGDMLISGTVFAGINFLSFLLCGIYRIYWPHASMEEFSTLFKAYLFSSVLFLLINFMARSYIFVPRTSMAVMLLSGFTLISIYRASWRFLLAANHGSGRTVKAVIIGAGDAGNTLARELIRKGDDLYPVGFLDDDHQKVNKKIAGVPVMGTLADVEKIVEEERVAVVIIAIPSMPRKRIGEILKQMSRLGVETRVLPSLREIADGAVSITMLRKVNLEDLLARDLVVLDNKEISEIVCQKVVLVTGAGGSIGSEIARQLCNYGPSLLLLLGHGEHSIYTLGEELNEKGFSIPFEMIIADVADVKAMKRVFERWHPSVVFHAAAHKHVPLMEFNPREAFRVNCYGTYLLSDLCGKYGVERMVMVSTDKAVNPSSVMGATKRVGEMLLQHNQAVYPETSYMAVRFGNVLGSRGSVIPKFEKQIERGGPVTVTHRDMRRYFMLIPEAAALVIQAGTIGSGGELFVLDMGEPVRIVDLAETLIRLHGYKPDIDISLEFSGVRPGEKLFEELFYDPDYVDRTSHPKIFKSDLSGKVISTTLLSDMLSTLEDEEGDIVAGLKKLVPEFSHN